MRMLALLLISVLSLASSSAFAASYQRNDGTIVDPIQSTFGGNLGYSGSNLEPFANLTGADLTNASLNYANLSGAELPGASLTGAIMLFADLDSANLNGVNLSTANLNFANLSGALLNDVNLENTGLSNANLSGAILANAVGLDNRPSLISFYDINTDFTNAWADGDFNTPGTILFDPVAAGWTLVPVPEPGTAILMGLGLAGLAARRR